jgi:probable HAF family extracellular repeat protein
VYQAAVYSNGVVTKLGFQGPDTFYFNNAGQVVSSNGVSISLYSNGKVTDLGGPGPQNIAYGISDAGQILGWSGYKGLMLYSNGKWTPLSAIGGPPGGSYPAVINSSGQIAGSFAGSSGQMAFLYGGGQTTYLGTPGYKSWAYGVNASGQVVGVDFKTGTATLFSGGKSIDLGALTKYIGGTGLYEFSGLTSMATAINNAGQIVGVSLTNGDWRSTPHAFLFTNGKMTDLNDLIHHTPDFVLTDAWAINNRGQILASGTYTGNLTDGRSYLLTPGDPLATPEPGSLTLLALGALGLAGHAWRKRRRSRITRSAPCTAVAPALGRAITKRFACGLAVLAVLLGSTGKLKADPIIWDYSPGSFQPAIFGELPLVNLANGLNAAERIYFASPVAITGMDIYGTSTLWPNHAQIGDSATIRLYADNSGQPGRLLTSFTEPISAVDSVGATGDSMRFHADFTTPLDLKANTSYWIGMSGTSKHIGQFGLMNIPASLGGDHSMALFTGTQFQSMGGPEGGMAFRLEGSVQPAPEPGSLTLLSLGVLGLAGYAWRKRQRLTRCAPCTAAAPAPGRAP